MHYTDLILINIDNSEVRAYDDCLRRKASANLLRGKVRFVSGSKEKCNSVRKEKNMKSESVWQNLNLLEFSEEI